MMLEELQRRHYSERATRGYIRIIERMEPHAGDFISQRVYPFCDLITLRHETCCLECDKTLRQPKTACLTQTLQAQSDSLVE
jgi:hypothetical protein